MTARSVETLIASWKVILDSQLSPGSPFFLAREQQVTKEIPFRVYLLTPGGQHALRDWEETLGQLLSGYGFDVIIERGATIATSVSLGSADFVIALSLSNDIQVFCGEFARVPARASKLLICVPEGDDGELYCRLARETFGVATISLPVDGLATAAECRFGVDLVKYCADYLMRKVAASVRALRIENTVVVIIHGIHTRAIWQGEIKNTLEGSGLVAIPTNYNKFDILRFLLPFESSKLIPLRKVEAEIAAAKRRFQDGHISLLAHSFGTYITGKLLLSADHRFDRIALCGSVLRSDFDFEQADGRFSKIVNEIGCRDIWPAVAAKLSSVYGPTGSFGFNRGNFVNDRKHSRYGHSHFLNRAFCERFWIPYFCDGTLADQGDITATPTSFVRFVDSIWFSVIVWSSLAIPTAGFIYFIITFIRSIEPKLFALLGYLVR